MGVLVLGGWLVGAERIARGDERTPSGASAAVVLGAFTFAGGEAERFARRRAIDAVTDAMSVFVRGIARARIERSTAIAERVSVARAGTRTVVSFDDRSYATEADGVGVEVTSATGERVILVHRWHDGVLEQTFAGKEGRRINLLRMREGRLVIDSRIVSKRLPQEIHFELSYARAR